MCHAFLCQTCVDATLGSWATRQSYAVGTAARNNRSVSRTRVLILGSTGSIGTQALDVIAANPDRFEVVGLAAAYQLGEPLGDRALPGTWIEDDIREIDSAVARSRLLDLSYQDPRRYRQLSGTDIAGLSEAEERKLKSLLDDR